MSRKSDRKEAEFVFVPLGGVGEIGMNLYLYGYGRDGAREWLIVDMGVTFGSDFEPGIDVILPDIRFLEDWNGQNFTYRGSIVDLWHSQQATGNWRCCGTGGTNYYTPPTRIWSYDTLFNTTPPPGTPQGVLILRGPWAQK